MIFTNQGITREHLDAYNLSCRLFDRQIASLLKIGIEDFWMIIEDCIIATLAQRISQTYPYFGEGDRGLSDWLFAESIVHKSGSQPCMSGIFVSAYLFECIYNRIMCPMSNLEPLDIVGERDLFGVHKMIDRITSVDERILLVYLKDLFDGNQNKLREKFHIVMDKLCWNYFSEKIKRGLPSVYCCR